ncbi:MAG: DUF4870 domain-containing protein [Chloroflexi bacterium]|nr:DUF4870 domain-containing protein [Chloroflexota bacterium]
MDKHSETISTEPNSDERVISAIAHGAIILPMWGLIAAIVIWLTQREKSPFVRQQALQAVSWQVTQILTMFVGMGCYMLSFLTMIPFTMSASGSNGEPPFFFFLPFAAMGLVFLLMFVFIVVGIVAAVRNLQGRPFFYPIIGKRLEQYMAN